MILQSAHVPHSFCTALYIYKGVTPAGSTQRYFIVVVGGCVRRRGKTENHGKEKAVGFSSASLFSARKREAITHGGTI